jgi:hypothetical protein
MSSIEAVVAHIRGEYREMPGLRLTFPQACRLWDLDPSLCEAVLAQLMAEAFLFRTNRGAYIAASAMGSHQLKAPLVGRRIRLPRSA